MAIKTLKGVEKIDGFSVVVMDELRAKYPEMFRPDGSMHYHMFEEKIRPTNFIYVRNDVNSISFTLQNGPVAEKGVNGCQVDTLIETAKIMLEGLNADFPSGYNMSAIWALDSAIAALRARKAEREARGVEGRNEK